LVAAEAALSATVLVGGQAAAQRGPTLLPVRAQPGKETTGVTALAPLVLQALVEVAVEEVAVLVATLRELVQVALVEPV